MDYVFYAIGNEVLNKNYIQGVTGGTDQTSGVFLRSNYNDITQNTYIQS
jgi:hypothetical protein